ncbi:hypothetical protein ACIQFU_15940 [Streptomyces sp. NPDC093065]|uniref:hypothetical protein n=1 Tax=Streptomyces sp. NPDC093065 TaxID=3366021 RepID=UPI00382772F1
MTLVVAFVRKAGNFSELVFASDSRLSGGDRNDHAQKVFQLPRSDALFSFAGNTKYAYPLMNQMIRAIEAYPQSLDRRLPLGKLRAHVLRVFQQSYSSIHGLPVNEKYPDDPDNFFLIGGFDWQTATIAAWVLSFDKKAKRFTFRPTLKKNRVCFVGDDTDATKEAMRLTYERLRDSGKTDEEIDMEPFEILETMIKNGKYDSIGGAPQLGKSFQHLNTVLFQVMWPAAGTGEIRPHMTGRPLLPMEQSTWPLYDPSKGFYSTRDSSSVLDVPSAQYWDSQSDKGFLP